MTYHVLNGDALAATFDGLDLPGETIVMREALITGDLQGDTLEAFWQTRAHYLSPENPSHYYTVLVKELEKLLTAPAHTEFNLWFGYDVFCRVNTWFIMSLLKNLAVEHKVFMVYPSFRSKEDIWKDFGKATLGNLQTAHKDRIACSEPDLQLGNDLWLAFKQHQPEQLLSLSQTDAPCFPYLSEVCEAWADQQRPYRVIEDIVNNVSSDFHIVFREFFQREGIYGFGDSQLKPLYDKVMEQK